jgi:NTE family protein
MASTQNNKTLVIADFTQDPRVLASMKELSDHFAQKPMEVSDVIDDKGNQYVDLVQKGGGVWGIALVGYTYVLEQMGIRFLRLAGTSAGAINTAMMTVIGNKNEAKSVKILQILCDLVLFKLVDGHPFARWAIKKFITNKDFTKKIKLWLGVILGIFVLLFLGSIVFLGLEKKYETLHYFTVGTFVLMGIYVVFLGSVLFYFGGLLRRLKNSGFGINPGDYFYDWLKKNMRDNGVCTVSELRAKASEKIPGLTIRSPRTEKVDDLVGSVTFITSEIVTENKIEFPLMCDLFRPKEKEDELQPAGFVRASMSIPIFFESYFINHIPTEDPQVKAAWMKRFQVDTPPASTRFVDGGMLSNFPINLFFNPEVTKPRLPTFGIDLDEIDPHNKSRNPEEWSLSGYLGRMFNTIRYYYDKDFLLKNKMMEKGIGKVNMYGYNWLNFFMTDQEKIDMFAIGVAAAKDFLIRFKWDEYMEERKEYMARTTAKNIE